ncbi:LysM peptidoglycan-binding domain-containing protein [Chromobacterium haemolyticum]|uniref:LysM peptidoglycan-binding domain-containing protein n=1 Tax=Chromobacterium fluminis TaxID=3044269 RepID=A0ABX0LCZ9_9NEIS|nr:LysM peptidoglycan-binding domain-containing protein [Chromobacterium haemolyticum]NHR08791.1 LysM peptidoglycan-binding domain-containing protein [Chromobacterium haemolyticum]
MYGQGVWAANWKGSTVDTQKIHFQSQPTDTTRLLLLTRPANSSESWQFTEVPPLKVNGQAVKGQFALDWSGMARKEYEFRYVAVNEQGVVRNVRQGRLNLNDSAPTMSQSDAAVDSALMDSNGWIHLSNLGENATAGRIRFRTPGGEWSTAQAVAGTSVTGIKGWFQFLPSNYGLAAGQTWEYELERLDANGQSLGAVVGAFRPGEAASVTQPVAWRDQPQIVHIGGNQPAAATRGLIRYRSAGGAWAEAPLSRAANGEWDWDSSALAKGLSAPTVYDFEYQLFDANGLMLNRAGGQLTLGGGAVSVNAKGLTLPLMVSFNPPQTQAAQLLLSYRSKGSQGAWTQAALSRNAQGQFALNADALAAGDYEYRYQLADAQGALLTGADGSALDVSGYLRRNSGVDTTRLDWVITGTSQSEHNIIRRQLYNAFGEVSSETDGRGNLTTFEYSAFGQLLAKQDPQTVIVAAGDKAPPPARTQYRYDALGNLVATVDANGQLNRQSWLAGGERGQGKSGGEAHADGGVKQLGYDVFGNLRVSVDEIGRRSDYRYNANNQLISYSQPLRADGRRGVDEYDYDSAGQRIAHRNSADGHTTLSASTQYDSLGRVLATVSAAGRRVSYRYQWDAAIAGAGGIVVGGWRSVKTDANGRSQTDDVSLFGHKVAHVDLGNHRFSYRYNHAGQVAEQSGSTGQQITYQYYGNGYLKSLSDHALDSYTLYEYDNDGNKTFEGYTSLNSQSREFYQYARIEYDARNRVTLIEDPKFLITYRYDAVGNRINVNSVYHDGVDGQKRTQDYWYRYDSMNRFVTTKGSKIDGQISRGPQGGDGVDILYNAAGERVQATYASNGNVETYSYSADGYLESTRINGKLAAQRDNDLLGRATAYREYRWNGDGGVSSQTQSRYDADHKLLQQTRDSATTTYTLMADGTVASSAQSSSGTTTTSYYGYEWWDEAKQSTITAQPYNKDAPGWEKGYSHLRYNVNGHLAEARDEVGQRSLRYVNNAQGLVLKREEIAKGSTYKRQDYYYLDGKQIGSVGNDGASRVDYAQALAQSQIGNRKDQYREGQPVNSADFDQNYEPIGPNYPGQTPGFVTVKAGDTLQSLAASLWGDQAMWYLLADANSLSGSEPLAAGQVLTVPNKVTNVHNNSGTYRVYSPGEAIGDVTPTLPDPPPPPQQGGGGCGGFGSIFIAIVAVVAVVVTAGALAPILAPGLAAAGSGLMASGLAVLGSAGASLGALAAAGIAGAVGSIASQGVAMAMGMQDRFSWGQVGLSAFSAAATAGLAGASNTSSLSAFAGKGLGETVARTMAVNAMTQGVAMATGLQKSFNWTSVAASGAAAGASSWMGDSLGWNSSDPVAGVGYGTLRGLVSGGIQSQLTGQRPNWSAIAAESFGSALGDQVVSGIQKRDERPKPEAERMAQAMEEMLTEAKQTRYDRRGAMVADGGKTRLVWQEVVSDAGPGYSVDGTALRPVSKPLQPLEVEEIDVMGQPLNGRSNYTIGQGWSRVMSGDASLWDFLTYQTPDAAQRRAELNAQWAPSKLVQQLDMLSSSPVATAAYLSTIWSGAGQAVQDTALTLGYAGGNVLGALAGTRTDATRLGLLGASNPVGGYGLKGLEGSGVVLELGGAGRPIEARTRMSLPSKMLRQTGGGGSVDQADELYDMIRKSDSDVKVISTNTGIKAGNIQKVKDHVFYNEHLLDKYVDYGIPAVRTRFDSDLSQALSWQRLESGAFTKLDIIWLKHETAERWYELRHGSGYTDAHNAAERKWTGNPWE